MLAYVAGILLILLAVYTMSVSFGWGGDALIQLVNWLKENPWESAIISILIIGVGIALFFIPRNKRFDDPAFQTSSQWGEVRVTYDAIREIVKRSALAVAGVYHIEAELHSRENLLEISIVSQLDPGVIIPEVSEKIQTQVKEAVESTTGIKVAEVKVLVRSTDTAHQARVR